MSTIQKEKTEKTSYDEHQDAVIREEKNAQFDYDSEAYAVQDKRILRKLDWHLLPFVSLLYLLSFLDRSNIGNARVAGLVNDLKLVGYQYNICAAVFFLLYSACEIPSNIALKLFRPSIWIPSIMVAWGLVMFCMMFVKSYHGLLIARIFLGATEAGLFPGVTYYISLWYRKREQARRVAIFFSAATVAGAFGGILAYAIAKMDGIGGFEGWAWIFGLEGILTILVAVIAYFRMHDYPQTAKFLKQEERDHVVDRLKRDSSNMATHFAWKFVWQALSDWKAYIQVIIYIGVLIPVYAFSLFLPTIIVGLGFNAARAQLMTIPPYCVGCFFTVFVGIYSDKYHLRGPFNLACSAVAIAGYSVLYATSSPGAGYAGTIIAAAGVFPTVPVTLAWAGNNAGGDMKRGVVLAMVIGLGNLGGICSSFIYRSVDAPRFHIGHGTVIGCLLTLFVFSTFAMWNYKRLNKIKEEYCQREGITEDRANEFREMADDSPLFRYTI